MDLREQIGQRLVIGFPGTELDPEFKRLVKEYKVGNVILFQRNLKSMDKSCIINQNLTKARRESTIHEEVVYVKRNPQNTIPKAVKSIV